MTKFFIFRKIFLLKTFEERLILFSIEFIKVRKNLTVLTIATTIVLTMSLDISQTLKYLVCRAVK